MKVKQLREELEYLDPDVEVRIASQPAWPMQHYLSDVVVDEATGIAYLSEGGQPYPDPYLPGHVAGALGWRDEPERGGWDPQSLTREHGDSYYGGRDES